MSGQLDAFKQLVKIISKLRKPVTGCPWDLAQTPDSIKGHIIEEAYEVVDAINRGNIKHFKEELGDLLLQIVLQSQMASECGWFSLEDVISEINTKLIRRHPHIFKEQEGLTTKQVLLQWEQIKKEEKERKSFLEGVPSGLPSLLYSQKLQTKAARVGFDWVKSEYVIDKLKEEVGEFQEVELVNKKKLEEEMGDILFTIVNLARQHKIDAESALLSAAEKFKRRFVMMEELARRENKDFEKLSLEEKERFWERVKERDG